MKSSVLQLPHEVGSLNTEVMFQHCVLYDKRYVILVTGQLRLYFEYYIVHPLFVTYFLLGTNNKVTFFRMLLQYYSNP